MCGLAIFLLRNIFFVKKCVFFEVNPCNYLKLWYFLYMSQSKVITKKEVAALIAERTGLNQATAFKALLATIDILAESLTEGKSVIFRKFGKFEVQTVKEKVGRNPRSPEKDVVIPARCRVKFTAGKELKSEVLKLKPTLD